jgi:hypothetical protein
MHMQEEKQMNKSVPSFKLVSEYVAIYLGNARILMAASPVAVLKVCEL